MKISAKLSVMVSVDNMGEIFMAGDVTIFSHTKHVDIRYKYVNEFIEDRIVKIVLVKSAGIDSNILMKNLSGELHESNNRRR